MSAKNGVLRSRRTRGAHGPLLPGRRLDRLRQLEWSESRLFFALANVHVSIFD